jgi:phage tail protein X
LPAHAPLQPEKASLVPGVSLSITWLFCGKLAEHVVGQLIPAGLLLTVPVPAPAKVTDRVTVAAKVAVTEPAALRVTLQAALPVHAPLQPEKALLFPGVSLSVTWLFCGKFAEHVVGQLIPAGVLVTVPDPVPAKVTDMVTVVVGGGPATTPRQPARTMVNRVDNTDQNTYRGFIAALLLNRIRGWMKPCTRWLLLSTLALATMQSRSCRRSAQ